MNYEPLTIERVKACNAMPEPIKSALNNLCDCWCKIALKEGKTEVEAAEVALDKLSEKILSFLEPSK